MNCTTTSTLSLACAVARPIAVKVLPGLVDYRVALQLQSRLVQQRHQQHFQLLQQQQQEQQQQQQQHVAPLTFTPQAYTNPSNININGDVSANGTKAIHNVAMAAKNDDVTLEQIVDEPWPDLLLLLQHPPTFTAGRRIRNADATEGQRLRACGADYVEVDRGGLMTFHGPGQLVAYPILALRDRKVHIIHLVLCTHYYII